MTIEEMQNLPIPAMLGCGDRVKLIVGKNERGVQIAAYVYTDGAPSFHRGGYIGNWMYEWGTFGFQFWTNWKRIA